MDNNTAKTIVKSILILGYIFSALGIALGIIALLASNLIASFILQISRIDSLVGSVAGVIINIIGVFLIIIGLVMIYLYSRLSMYKNWARIALVVLTALAAISALFNLPESILSLFYNGAVCYFLGFNKDIIAVFTPNAKSASKARAKKKI